MGINKAKILKTAQKYSLKKNWDKAAREYRKIVEDDPNDARNRLKLADCLVKSNNFAEALAAYKEVAFYYLQDDIYDKAVAVFKQALRLAEDDPELHRSLGDAYHRLGRLKEANRALHQAQKIYKGRGDIQSQRLILEQMVRIDPEDYGLRIGLAERYAKDGMTQEAINLFEYAARMLEEEGRTDEYIQVAERILYLDKANTRVRRRVIELNMDARNYERALKHLQVAFRADEQNVEILSMLGLAFEHLGKTDRAILVHADLANKHYRRQDMQAAIASWEEVLRLDQKNQDAQKWLAHLRRKVLEDSGSIPGIANTGNLGGDPLRQSTQPNRRQQQPQQKPQPQQHSMADVEFLDDDLGLELAPVQSQRQPVQTQNNGMPYRGNAQQPKQPQQPSAMPYRGTPQQPTQQSTQHANGGPHRGTPQQPAQAQRGVSLDSQLADLTAESIDEINFNQLQSYPTQGTGQQQSQPSAMPYRGNPQQVKQQPSAMPYRGQPEPVKEPEEILEIEFIPEVAEADDDETIKQHLNETRVFLKYGLYDKAIQSLMDLSSRFPKNTEVREELAGVYLKRGPKVMAADQYLELARIVRDNKPQATEYLKKALTHINEPAMVHAVANELNINLGGGAAPKSAASNPVKHDTLVEPSDIDALNNAFEQMLGGKAQSDVLELDESPSIELLDDDDLLELDDSELMLEEESIAREQDQSFEWASDNVDAMFDDLFQEVDDTGIRASAIGRSSISGLGDMGDLDDIIERGLAQEQQRDDSNLVADESPSMQRGRLQLGNMHSGGLNVNDPFAGQSKAMDSNNNPFGQQSLSGSFRPGLGEYSMPQSTSAMHGTGPGLVNAGAIMNTNFELGAAYMEMGLLEEAFDEFKQAAEDPEITNNAIYSMALCEYKLGRVDNARGRLQQLLGKQGLNGQLQQASQTLLAKL